MTSIEEWVHYSLKNSYLRISSGCRLEQLRNTFYASVLKRTVENTSAADADTLASTTSVIVKCTHSSNPEAALTKTVALILPQFVPQILAVKDDHTFLQKGAVFSTVSPEIVFEGLGDMQFQSITRVDALRAGGIPCRDVGWHSKFLEQNLAHPMIRDNQILTVDERFNVRKKKLEAVLAELDAYNLPNVLVHGDFSDTNILTFPSQKSPVFIDWETVCIGHPFIDFLRITEAEWDAIEDEHAKTKYLNRWNEYESKDNIKRALRLAFFVLLLDNLYVLCRVCAKAKDLESPPIRKAINNRVEAIFYGIDKF